ncbi:hypothetical protein EU803_13205 [Loktanella sp. IMCC34160]|uniref:YrhB domain-containing protein n=1 Tax=Loktanella sp. IMCC34160 TaxID=2510646 RepID=UPI00101D22DF|nr:YrhB domain-containing protein [Loktanella sp. IMCC34160]RYG90939.1 hypothetical protein EU803_13205 [Loktanella sp. IMCC34160]
MISRSEAAQLVRNEIEGFDCVLLEEPIAEGAFGWVFGYQSAKFIESGSFSDALFGNAPFLVERETGRLHVLGTARPAQFYVDNFIKSGDPHRANR